MFYQKHKNTILPIAVFPVFLLLWDVCISLFNIPEYLLPRPVALFNYGVMLFRTGVMVQSILITLQEVLIGTGIGILIGLILGYIMAKIRVFERIVMPFVIILQTAPKISLAPLLILWMGLGIQSKVVLVILVVAFPIMVNQVTAIRSIDENAYNMMKVLKASKLQVFYSVELPYSFEMLLSGIKLAITQAVTGAVIGEMIGAKAGLGYLLTLGSETYDIRMILCAVIVLSVIGLLLYFVANLLERKILYWKEIDQSILN